MNYMKQTFLKKKWENKTKQKKEQKQQQHNQA